MILQHWWNSHPMAEIEAEIDGYRFTLRFSGHYRNPNGEGACWMCYGIHWLNRQPNDELPLSLTQQAWAFGVEIASKLQYQMPPSSYQERFGESVK